MHDTHMKRSWNSAQCLQSKVAAHTIQLHREVSLIFITHTLSKTTLTSLCNLNEERTLCSLRRCADIITERFGGLLTSSGC